MSLPAAVLLSGVFLSAGALAAPAILVSPDPQPRDGFGLVVAAHDDLIAVGAPGADTSIAEGYVHLYEFDGTAWRHAATLQPPEGFTHEGFGLGIAIDAARVVVGAPRADLNGFDDTGAAYVFVRTADGFRLEARLTAADAAPRTGFGTSVALDGGRLIVGANGRIDEFGPPLGAAYVFEHDDTHGWQQHARLQPAAYRDSLYGSEVALSASSAAVGAPNNGVDGKGMVMFYVREDSGWFENGIIAPELGGSLTSFASARMVMEGSRIAISADSDQASFGGAQGRVYVYERGADGWQEQAVLAPPSDEGHGFGWSLAMAGDHIAVTQTNGSQVFLFRRNASGWSLIDTLAPEGFISVSRRALALTANRLVVGSEGEAQVHELAETADGNAASSPDAGGDVVLIVEPIPERKSASGGGGIGGWLAFMLLALAPRLRVRRE